MPPPRRYKAPPEHGDILADPDLDLTTTVVARNRLQLNADLDPAGRAEVIAAAVAYLAEVGEPVPTLPAADAPLIVTGHQPELSHPGVWAKNFAANGIARRVEGVALNLIADTDTIKSATLRLPQLGDGTHLTARVRAVPFDDEAPETSYELRRFLNPGQLAACQGHIDEAARRWPFRPMADLGTPTRGTIGEHFSSLRRARERQWGCHNLELPVSRLCRTAAFERFVALVERDFPRFVEAYNGAILDYRHVNRVQSRNHPAPLLEPGERPFWRMTPTGRERPFAAYPAHELRPRALTLTLFARLHFADLFIHGIGGGKYDEVTDAIIRRFCRVEPPKYQVLTLTGKLPFPVNDGAPSELRELQRRSRDVRWNPQRHMPSDREATHETRLLLADLAGAMSGVPATPRGRRDRWARIRALKAELGVTFGHAEAIETLRPELERRQAQEHVRSVLSRRDYAWVLFPEETLRPLMRQFLNSDRQSPAAATPDAPTALQTAPAPTG